MPESKRIEWDKQGERFYEMGVSHGVLYKYDKTQKAYGKGVPWNGLSSVGDKPEGAEATDLWADDMKYASFRSTEIEKGSIEAYTYPKEFEECDGSVEISPGVTIGQQGRSMFAFSYRTAVGSDTDPDHSDYKLHIVYGATASPSEKSYESINESPDAITFSWEFDTTPVAVPGHKPTSTVTFDSRTTPAEKLKAIEDALYGTDDADPYVPMPEEILELLGETGGEPPQQSP